MPFIVLPCVVALLLGIVYYIKWKKTASEYAYCPDWIELTGLISCLVLGLLFCMNLGFYIGNKAQIEKYHAFKETITEAREGDLELLERAAILKDIAKWNTSIAEARYYNKWYLWDWFVPDELAELPRLK